MTPGLFFLVNSEPNAKWHQGPEDKRKAKHTRLRKRADGSGSRRGHGVQKSTRASPELSAVFPLLSFHFCRGANGMCTSRML